MPEVVIEGEGIFQAKDENEPGQGDEVEAQHVDRHAELDCHNVPETFE